MSDAQLYDLDPDSVVKVKVKVVRKLQKWPISTSIFFGGMRVIKKAMTVYYSTPRQYIDFCYSSSFRVGDLQT